MPQDTPQYKLAGTSNFAFVYAFISTFQPILGTEPVEPEELEGMLLYSQANQSSMSTLMLSLVAYALNMKSPISPQQWSKKCSVLAKEIHNATEAEIPHEAMASLQGFLDQEPEIKVAIIKWLCEHMLDCNEYLHRTIDSHVNMPKRGKGSDNFRPSFIRLEPYAVDSLRRQYWLLGNESRFMYRETNPGSGRASWELVATSVPQFRSISDQLKRTRTKINKAIASSIDTEIIPLLERRAKRIEQREKAMRRNMDLFSNVQILESRTRKRKNVNYNVDDMDVDFEEDPLYYTAA